MLGLKIKLIIYCQQIVKDMVEYTNKIKNKFNYYNLYNWLLISHDFYFCIK